MALRKTTRRARAERRTRLKLKLSARTRRTVKRALRHGRRLRANVKVRVSESGKPYLLRTKVGLRR